MKVQEQTDAAHQSAFDDVRIFLTVMAMALRETVVLFEETTSRVTDVAVMRSGRADRDLVVMLQNFDRLQQEFATLADVFNEVAAKPRESWLQSVGGVHPADDVIGKIPIGDLKERVLRYFASATAALPAEAVSEEVVF